MTEPNYEIDIDFDEQAFDEEAPLSPPDFFDDDYDYADDSAYIDALRDAGFDMDEGNFNEEW